MSGEHSEPCLFCEIVRGDRPAWTFWEDRDHMALLTPFPNTRGFSVVIPKRHLPSYVFEMHPEDMHALFAAARTAAHLLDRALGTTRTGLIAEGMGIDHAHLKLAPMHGVARTWRPVRSTVRTVYERYPGYIASHDGPPACTEHLDRLVEQLRRAHVERRVS